MPVSNISNLLKQLRKTSAYSAKQVIEKLKEYNIDISAKTLYGYESGLSMPNADVFVSLCKIYKCDNPMAFFGGISLAVKEASIIEKYRTLDPQGQEHINAMLDWESQRTSTIADQADRIAELEQQSKVTQLPDCSYLEPVAAHDRTDISDDSRTDELKNLEASIMDNEDEWK